MMSPNNGRRGVTPPGGKDSFGGIFHGFAQLPLIRKYAKTVQGRPRSVKYIITNDGPSKADKFFPSKRPSTAPYANSGQREDGMGTVIAHPIDCVRDMTSPRKGKTRTALNHERRQEAAEVALSSPPKEKKTKKPSDKPRVPPGGKTSVDLC